MSDILLYESNRCKVFHRKNGDQTEQIIKILNIEFPTPAEIREFNNEYEISKFLPDTGMRKCMAKMRENGKHALLFNYTKGETLKKAFVNKQDDLIDFLYIARSACLQLGRLHQQGIIHGDLNPYNIIVDLQQREVTIIDFSTAARLELSRSFQCNPEQIQGNLAYISPEQTGRMNRTIDYRSDLYSLGICFYEMVTGQLPFAGKDPLDIIHQQIACTPQRVSDVNKNIPEVIADIIMKLLQKNAEDRYRSAFGVNNDLDNCLLQLQQKGNIEWFAPGQKDYSGRFLLPQKLYGREGEVEQLIRSFDYCSEGHASLVLVSGFSGTGKSALVNEIHKPITAKNGYYIAGKFEQYHRTTPYFALLHAFNQLIQVFLAQDKTRLKKNTERIQAAVGEEGKVIVNVLPLLENLIGPQPDIPDVGGNETQSRFNYVFSKFVRAVCSADHPLVLFIDDLQWADSASLQLLEVLLTDKQCKWLQCICAYRDNEVSASHPAMQTVHSIRKSDIHCIDIYIGNLSIENINQMLSEATGLSLAQTSELTALIHRKTQGNAFFTVKFLKSIADDNHLVFDYAINQWTWNIDALRQMNVSDNVVEFLAGKIRQLPEHAKQFLQYAACLGNIFKKSRVQNIGAFSDAALEEAIFDNLKNGLVVEVHDDQYKFVHDRIQQSAYSLISEEEKALLHYTIGKQLYALAAGTSFKEQIFETADQINEGLAHVRPDERITFAQLNLQAGSEAKLNSAFSSAASYYANGIKLLANDSWQQEYSLTLALYTGACEAAYLNADFELMEQYFAGIDTQVENILEKLKSHETRILALKAQNRLVEAVDAGLNLLKALGEPLPSRPKMLHVGIGLSSLLLRLRNKSKDYFLGLPQMTDPYKIAAMRIIADITSCVYWARPNLLPMVVFKMMNISLKYGNNEVSCFAYGSFGVILCGVLGMMKRGNEFGEISLELLDKLDAKEWKAQIYVSPYALTFHWRNHIDKTLKPLQESFQIGLETGLIEFACINTNIYCIHAFLSGKELNRLEEETKAYSDSYRQMKQETNVNYNEVYRQAMHNFLGKNQQPLVLSGEAFDEDKMFAQHIQRNDRTGTFFIHFLKLMLGYYFQDYVMAAANAQKARKLLDAVLAKFEIPNLYFYEALTLLKLYEQQPAQHKKYLRRVKGASSALRKWAKHAPMNFLHKYQLIQAEKHRVLGSHYQAVDYYEKAIENAATNRYLHEEALARELTGKFYLNRKQFDLAEYYLRSAFNLYQQWGANAKLEQMKQELSATQISFEQAESKITGNSASTAVIRSSSIDFATFSKSAAAISGEVVLPNLFRTLLHNVIENTGAQQGVLLLETNGLLKIKAYNSQPDQREEILIDLEPEGSGLLSEAIVAYTKRTRKALVLPAACEDNRFEKDVYLQEHSVLSVMCLPIMHHSKFVGILYLENRTTRGTFTNDRVELISLLSAQMAISIENAQLYESLEQKVQERTEELQAEKQKSDKLLYNILPYETAQEIKQFGFSRSRFYESVTVLFTDFQGFTSLSSNLTPNELVDELNECFKTFDQIAEKYKIEKIKTIGDAYMAACGIPIPNSVHAENTILAAMEIRDYVHQRRINKEGVGFQLRIGIHTGPLVAGIVGTTKFQYDIWGDTVNIASRMESNGIAGCINVSATTYELVKQLFVFEEREETEVKGKGKMKMYFVIDKLAHGSYAKAG
jgi:histidine kinase